MRILILIVAPDPPDRDLEFWLKAEGGIAESRDPLSPTEQNKRQGCPGQPSDGSKQHLAKSRRLLAASLSIAIAMVAGIPGLAVVFRRDLAASQPYQMAALIGIAALLRARLAAHALLQLPDWRFPGAPDDGQVHDVMRPGAIAPRVERVAEQWRWLRRAASLSCEYSTPRRRPNRRPCALPCALLGSLDRAEVPTEEAAYSGLLDHLLALPGMIAFPIFTAASPSFSSQLSWPSFFLQSYVGPMTWFFLQVSSTF